MKNNFAPSASIRSAGAIAAAAGIFKVEKRTPWELNRQVPHDVKVARLAAAAREEIAANREAITKRGQQKFAEKNGIVTKDAAPLGVYAQKVEGGYKVLGFGVIVPEIADVFHIAKENARAFVKVDGQIVESVNS